MTSFLKDSNAAEVAFHADKNTKQLDEAIQSALRVVNFQYSTAELKDKGKSHYIK